MGIFGNIARAITGDKKAKSKSLYASEVYDQFNPMMGYGAPSMGQAANILGLGGGEAQDEALGNWYDSSGGKFLLNQGLDDVDAMYRSRGLGQSGATMKAMENYRSGLASTKLNEYLGNLNQLSGLSLGAGNLIGSLGQTDTEKGNGLGKIIGSLLASDPDMKTDIVQTGTINVYEFRYRDDPSGKVYRGIMADEVAREIPDAAGPLVDGYRTIDLTKLGRTL